MFRSTRAEARSRAVLRVLLSHYVAVGVEAALGLLAITALVHAVAGEVAAAAASVGVVVCIPPDQAAPQRGKFWQLLPAALIGLPLFMATEALRASPLWLGAVLGVATFVAFLAGAWGKRGVPLTASIMFAVLFSMAIPIQPDDMKLLASGGWFALGSGLYLVWATLANAALNGRYRTQMLADALLSLGALMRAQARQFAPRGEDGDGRAPVIGELLGRQAALADQLQAARDILLEAPRTERRQRLAAMLMQVLEARDHLLACELDLETVQAEPAHAPLLARLREQLEALAGEVERLADALLLGRRPGPFTRQPAPLDALRAQPPAEGGERHAALLARALANRVGYLDEEAARLFALARGEAVPDLALVRANWQMFVSPTVWSWKPFANVWRWDAPPLRHALRAVLAIGTAYALALALPWGTHDYWILLTIVVVLRGSLAQTLERRNHRVAGTLLGCLIAAAFLSLHPSPVAVLVVLTLAQAVAHAFAVRRYLVTAVGATVLGLVQAHQLNAGASPAFELVERMADTLLGVGIAWAFSYVLPSWERHQIPALLARTLAAQARHAREALGLVQLQAVDNTPELAWRLARREAYDSLSALVQATQRSLAEPRAVRPPLEPLGRLLVHGYQLLAQLTAVKAMLLLRRGRLNADTLRGPLAQSADTLTALLAGTVRAPATARAGAGAGVPGAGQDDAQDGLASSDEAQGPVALPDPLGPDLGPWLLRRLDLAEGLAARLRADADRVSEAAGG